MTDDQKNELLQMTTGIVANFVSHNRVSPDELAGVIAAVHAALSNVGETVEEPAEPAAKLTAAQVRKLITPSGIVSLIDNRVFKSMKRHLSLHGYTPSSYREAFGLPADFPMVAPEYAAARSALAKTMGLGQKGRQPAKPVRAKKAKAAVTD